MKSYSRRVQSNALKASKRCPMFWTAKNFVACVGGILQHLFWRSLANNNNNNELNGEAFGTKPGQSYLGVDSDFS